MSEHITPDPDSLGDLLAPPPPPADDRLREDLRKRTGRVVRWRWRWRRIAQAAALAACYAAGVLTVHLPQRPDGRRSPEMTRKHHLPQRPDGRRSPEMTRKHHLPQRPDGRRSPEESVAPETPALALEWQALDSPQPRPDLYRQAGDRYLDDENDLESALRCYGQALNAAGEADRTVAVEDNWLLMTIKNARQKEKCNAKSLD
jgi:hypothetical protein